MITGVHLWLLLMKSHAAVAIHAHESIKGLEICDSDFFVLEALLHKGPLPVNTIGQKVRLTSGSISVAIDRLVQKRYVERFDSAKDRRVRLVQLTPEGRRLVESSFASHARAMEAAAGGLTMEERCTLGELLKKLGKSAEALPFTLPAPAEHEERDEELVGAAHSVKQNN